MNPKKANKVIEERLSQITSDPELCRLLFEEYWASVRKTLEQKKYPRVNLLGLGVMIVNGKKLFKVTNTTLHKINSMKKTNTFARYKLYDDLQKRAQLLEELRIKLEEIYKQDQKKLKERYGEKYYHDMERKGEDAGGNQELNI